MFASFHSTLRKGLIAVAGLACFVAMIPAQAVVDPVILTFASVGDSRQDPIAPDSSTLPVSQQDQIWLENTKAWSRIIRSIQSQKANMLFFNGDMVMGYGNGVPLPKTTNVGGVWTPASLTGISGLTTDTTDFYAQYGYWRGMVSGLMETGTYVVPVPGNHETQCKACGKIATVGNESIWRENMGDLIMDTTRFSSILGAAPDFYDPNNHPAIGDALSATADPTKTYTTDQSKLSYSFDFKGCHFAVVNTDATGVDGRAPADWLANDFAAASARGATHFFVFGHKPAYTYKFTGIGSKLSGLDATSIPFRDAFWNVIEQYHATYFTGHEHIFNMQQPLSATIGATAAWQVLVGSGGSPFETATATPNPNDRKYAWANVRVFQSGKVEIDAYGFDENFGPTQLLQTVTLPQ